MSDSTPSHQFTVAIRVDSGVAIGGGHVMRCLALANELRHRGAQVRFVSRPHTGHLSKRVEQEGFQVSLLPPGTGSDSDATDARDTVSALDGPVDWMVVDHYSMGADWETAARAVAKRLLVIDDLANRPHAADALLDQNFARPATSGRYDALVPTGCARLLGPRFALLAPEYSELRRTPSQGRSRVLIAFGGSDPANATGKALEALASPNFAGRDVDVVLGANHPCPQDVIEQAARRSRTQVHQSPPSLAPLLARASASIGAGGITTWERLCLQVPSLVVTIAANQVPSTRALAEAGYIRWIGSTPDVGDYIQGLRDLPADLDNLPPLVDGLGARRVAEFMCPSTTLGASLRHARLDDASLFFDWRNEPDARAQSFSQDPISWPSHRRWFEAKLGSGSTDIFVGEIRGLPIGQVRLDFERDECVLSYSVDAVVRGRGWGGWLVAEAMKGVRPSRCRVMRADVREANTASRRVFRRLGWQEAENADGRVEFSWSTAAGGVGESR